MKKLFVFLLLAFITVGANAQHKFAHLNSGELFTMMPARDTAMKKLEAFAKDMEEIFEGANVEFNKKVADFEKNQTIWSETIKTSKQKELVELQRRLQEQQQTYQTDLEKEQQKYLVPIQETIRTTIAKVAKENKFTYVFDVAGGGLLYFDPVQSVDIMPLMKKELKITK